MYFFYGKLKILFLPVNVTLGGVGTLSLTDPRIVELKWNWAGEVVTGGPRH